MCSSSPIYSQLPFYDKDAPNSLCDSLRCHLIKVRFYLFVLQILESACAPAVLFIRNCFLTTRAYHGCFIDIRKVCCSFMKPEQFFFNVQHIRICKLLCIIQRAIYYFKRSLHQNKMVLIKSFLTGPLYSNSELIFVCLNEENKVRE